METISLPDVDRREIGKDAYYQTFTLEIDFTSGRAIRVQQLAFLSFLSCTLLHVCVAKCIYCVLNSFVTTVSL